MSRLKSFADRRLLPLEKVLNIIGVITILIMMFLITSDALLRTFANSPIYGTYEISQMLMATLVFLGLAYAQAVKSHIRVDIIIERLSPKNRIIFDLVTYTFLVAFAGVLTVGCGLQTIYSWQSGESSFGMVNFPIYPSRTIAFVGSLFLFVRASLDVLIGISNLKHGGALPETDLASQENKVIE